MRSVFAINLLHYCGWEFCIALLENKTVDLNIANTDTHTNLNDMLPIRHFIIMQDF